MLLWHEVLISAGNVSDQLVKIGIGTSLKYVEPQLFTNDAINCTICSWTFCASISFSIIFSCSFLLKHLFTSFLVLILVFFHCSIHLLATLHFSPLECIFFLELYLSSLECYHSMTVRATLLHWYHQH